MDAPVRRALQKKARRKTAFLTALEETGNVTRACAMSGLPRRTAYDAKAADPEFAKAWESALDTAADALECEARRRALLGTDRPVFGRVGKDQDGQIGAVRDYSDTLLIFLLKAARPDKFRERYQVTGPGGAPVQIQYVNDWRGEKP